jgi:hypothetical protein
VSRDLAERVRALHDFYEHEFLWGAEDMEASRSSASFDQIERLDALFDGVGEALAESTPAAPDEEGLERAIEAAYDELDNHDHKRHPGHSGTCQDDWARPWRLAPLVARALASQDKA